MQKSYVEYIQDRFRNFKNSGEDIDETLLHFPDLVELLCNMLDEDSVSRDSRILINAALGYFVVANDVLPDDVYGPDGYMDDMYIACIVLSRLKPNYPDIIEKLWDNDSQFDKVLELCTYKSEKYLDEKNLKEKSLRYCGLSD